ncbi:hypothetical protein SAMN05216328_104223 [Ensifer sp. YR511]|jgi:hypothetical protein|nr:hypothetical protein SAMN05216328_104223 [Ensifer sp. YR511]
MECFRRGVMGRVSRRRDRRCVKMSQAVRLMTHSGFAGAVAQESLKF